LPDSCAQPMLPTIRTKETAHRIAIRAEELFRQK